MSNSRALRVWIAVGALVVACGAIVGFAVAGQQPSDGRVGTETPLPALTTVTLSPETIYLPPVLPTTTTTTAPPRFPNGNRNSTSNTTGT